MTNSQTESLINYLRDNKFAANDQDAVNKLIQVVESLFNSEPELREGTNEIKFDAPATYGSVLPLEGPITISNDNFRAGVTQLVIHLGEDPNIASMPNVIVLAGTYAEFETNYIMFHAVTQNMILVTISKQI